MKNGTLIILMKNQQPPKARDQGQCDQLGVNRAQLTNRQAAERVPIECSETAAQIGIALVGVDSEHFCRHLAAGGWVVFYHPCDLPRSNGDDANLDLTKVIQRFCSRLVRQNPASNSGQPTVPSSQENTTIVANEP